MANEVMVPDTLMTLEACTNIQTEVRTLLQESRINKSIKATINEKIERIRQHIQRTEFEPRE